MGALKDPHGGALKNLYLDEASVKDEKARARDLPSWDLSMRQLCDIEMLLNGAFSPLEGFLGEGDYKRVLSGCRGKASGCLSPVPSGRWGGGCWSDSATTKQTPIPSPWR
jgi:sulfate adenylyltransferase